MKGPIALLTDFGLRDPFAGVMKGVILGLNPRAVVVDLCHDLPPHDLRAGAFALRCAFPYFPRGTVFVAVVDPGVGSARRALWARAGGRQALFPDNGLIGWLEAAVPLDEVREVSNRRLFLEPVSATFHGRDVFAPVAARLSLGLSPASLGPRTRRWERLPFPSPAAAGKGVRGEILSIDRFGNAVTNLSPADVAGRRVRWRGRPLGSLRGHYAAAGPGEALAVAGSAGFVELSVNGGSFAGRFGAVPGDPVEAA